MSELKVKWPKVMDYNDIDRPPLIEWIDLGNGTMFRIFAFFSHGGYKRPRDGLIVGIERVGSFLFQINKELNAGYVSQKLNVPESDAAALADFLNVQLNFDSMQQGIYSRNYIEKIEPYYLAGERAMQPLTPEIIE